MAETPRRTPRQSAVQGLQNALAYTNVYPTITSQPSFSRRWRGPKGFGTRHVNDDIPFSLWDEHSATFRPASRTEMSYIGERYNAERVTFYEWILVVETCNPPKPVPLTVAGMPVHFVPPGDCGYVDLYGLAPYPSRRIADPCPHVSWDKRQSPTKEQMCAVIAAVSELAHIRRVNFLPAAIVVELEHGDNKDYSRKSLPGTVANRATTYHHGIGSFVSSVRNHARERLLDPAGYVSGPLPQDPTDYINEPNWSILSPGMRISPGYTADTGVSLSTTSGIILRKGENCYVTVSNHGFPNTEEVFHPTPSGEKIGHIVDRYPELDIAMVRLTPANADRYINRAYFQADAPRRFAEASDMVPGSWFEVDGMSTGLLSLLYCGRSMERPPGHPPIPVDVDQWQQKNLFNVFGATNPELIEGMCGPPLVEQGTGLVAGFFHLAVGDWVECAVLDDLVAEGWQVG